MADSLFDRSLERSRLSRQAANALGLHTYAASTIKKVAWRCWPRPVDCERVNYDEADQEMRVALSRMNQSGWAAPVEYLVGKGATLAACKADFEHKLVALNG